MNHEHHQIGAAAARLADRLPHSVMIAVAGAVALHGSLERAAARQAILQSLPTPDFRDATTDFLNLWHSSAASVGAEAVAVALVTAATSEQDHRKLSAIGGAASPQLIAAGGAPPMRPARASVCLPRRTHAGSSTGS